MTGTIRWSLAAPIILGVVILQAVFFDQFMLFGRTRIDAPLLFVVGLAYVADLDAAAVLAFVTGILVDVFQFGPFGLHALVYLLAVWGIAAARVRILQPGTSFQVVQGAIAVALVTGLSRLVGRVFGLSPLHGREVVVGLVGAAVVGALLGAPAAKVAAWTLGERRMRRDLDGVGG